MPEEEEIILTKEGKEKLEEELHTLEHDKRAEVSARIKVAREFGDISENSEYDDAKNEQAQVEKRISEINHILQNAKIVKKPAKNSDKISIGSKVKVNMGGKQNTFTIVGGSESDIANGKISNSSPVGKALCGHKKGEKVEAEGPTGKKIEIKILEVKHD